jgi:hypothetical protein
MENTCNCNTLLPEVIAKIAEMTEANLTRLTQLDERLKVIEVNELRFQIAVASKLSRIEAMAQILGISDLINNQKNYPKSELTIYEKVERREQLIKEESREIERRMLDLMQGPAPKRRAKPKPKTNNGVKPNTFLPV